MRDLIAFARRLAAQMRGRAAREKSVLALYGPPQCLRWGVEALSNRATADALEPAATALLTVGLSEIRSFPGVTDICEARKTLLPLGDPETLHWLDHFPLFAVSAMRTDNARNYRLRVDTDLHKQLSQLARSLGLPLSQLGTYALMARLIQAPSCCAAPYRRAMVRTLKDLRAVINRRAEEARSRVVAAGARDTSKDHLFTIEDVTGPSPNDEDMNDD